MKRTLLSFFTLSIIYLTVSSSASGPSNSNMNAAVSGCGGVSCHGSGSNTATTISLELKVKSSGDVVSNNEYAPNEVYTVTITGNNASAAIFGFIAEVQAGGNPTGTLANAGSGAKITSISGGRTVVEHSSTFPAVGGSFSATFEWTAPAKGSGNAVFLTAVNGANGASGADPGDQWNTSSFTFTEGPPVSVDDFTNDVAISVYPNPVTHVLNIDIVNGNSNAYKYVMYNMSGALTLQGTLGSNVNTINVAALSSGVHFLKITDGTSVKTVTFTK